MYSPWGALISGPGEYHRRSPGSNLMPSLADSAVRRRLENSNVMMHHAFFAFPGSVADRARARSRRGASVPSNGHDASWRTRGRAEDGRAPSRAVRADITKREERAGAGVLPPRAVVTAPSGLPPRSDRGCWHRFGRPAVPAPRGAGRGTHRPCSP